MAAFEVVLCVSAIILCGYSVFSDIREGIIKNRVLLCFAILAIVFDVPYYFFFSRGTARSFLLNALAVAAFCLILFYTHSLAGGDCKLCIVLAMLYPGRFYLSLDGNSITLIMAVCFAILWGYFYLLALALSAVFSGKTKLTAQYVKSTLAAFAKSYCRAIVYISALNVLFLMAGSAGALIPELIQCLLCLLLAWLGNRTVVLKNTRVIIITAVSVVCLSFYFKIMPVTVNVESYTFAFGLLLVQMMIQTVLYKDIPVNELKKGMILTELTSFMMQGAKIKGLPGVSFEDLRSRLTDSEIASIKKWADCNGVVSVSIVRKFPFAIFVTLGFVTYFCLWGFAA